MKSLFILLAALINEAHGAASILGLKNAKVVPNSFIVVLKPSASEEAVTSHLRWADGVVKSKGAARKSAFTFNKFKAYHLQASEEVAALLAESDEIDYIEADQIYTIPTTPRTKERVARIVQTNAPWNLARISHHLPGSSEYVYQPISNVYAYILDTGVKVSHTAFGGTATFGYNAVGGSNDDGNGHGTHLAGIVSSQTYGVARFANIISVKILGNDGSAAVSQIISGMNWAVQNMIQLNRVGKSTALLSASGGYSAAMNNAVAAATNAGLFFAVPAGDAGGNGGNYSPGSAPSACTVGASTQGDTVASYSGWGSTLDIFAPGTNIRSIWITSNTATNVLSGTSLAAAHIAGLGAYFLALEGPRTPVALCERLRQVATANVLTGVPAGTPNLLAYNLSGL